MRYYSAKTDANQTEIVEALRAIGAMVYPTHRLGGGFPDLLVGWKGRLLLLEVKDGSKPPSARLLTDKEQGFHAAWTGYPVIVVESAEQAIAVVRDTDEQARRQRIIDACAEGYANAERRSARKAWMR